MTIVTGHGMDVMDTLPVKISGVHGPDIQTATAYCRVATQAGIPGIIGVSPVTGPATNSLMDTHQGPVIFGSGLVSPIGGMALHADPLHRIIRYQDGRITKIHIWFPELIGSQMHPVGPEIEPGKRVAFFSFVKD